MEAVVVRLRDEAVRVRPALPVRPVLHAIRVLVEHIPRVVFMWPRVRAKQGYEVCGSGC